MKPGRVYEWDFESNELIETSERTERITDRPERNRGTGSSDDQSFSCGDELGTWTLERMNGQALPYRLKDGISDVTEGWIRYNSDKTWSGENRVEGYVDGQLVVKKNSSTGVYTCKDGEIDSRNTNNQRSGAVSVSGSRLYLHDANGNRFVFRK